MLGIALAREEFPSSLSPCYLHGSMCKALYVHLVGDSPCIKDLPGQGDKGWMISPFHREVSPGRGSWCL